MKGAVSAGTDPAAHRVRGLRSWAWLHKWSSLVCTAFLFLMCLTGLPLVFSDEIDNWLAPRTYEELPATTPNANLDDLVTATRQRYPGQIVTFISIDPDEPQTAVFMAPSWAAVRADPSVEHFIRFDSRTARVLEESTPAAPRRVTFLGLMLHLHRDLFLSLPGELFLGLMGALFVVAIVSGVLLYEPFTRKLEFGTVRRNRSRRLWWLDLHNLFGVVTLAWTLVVGLTGVMNELSTPLFGLWQLTDVQALLRPWQGKAPPLDSQLAPVQAALRHVQSALPGRTVTSIVFPGSESGSPQHYVLWAKGNTPLTRRLFNPVLADARSAQLTAVIDMPWYLRALEISRPLHFGDYGGMPLKILWALLDVVTLGVLGTGLYLWLSPRRSPVKRRLAALGPDPAGWRAAGIRD